jgi:prepilin-type N-terminal cleavage/methylation domain-containing protein
MLKLILMKRQKLRIVRDEKGLTLVEVVISIALLGIVTAGLFTGLGTASNVVLRNDIRQTAKNLAEYQMESVKNREFKPTYLSVAIPPEQSDYTATITVVDGSEATVFIPDPDPNINQARDSHLQKIIVKIFKSGVLVYTLEGYKVE